MTISRRLAPGVPDLIFGLVLASVLVGGRYRLLNDPGTLWHLKLGQQVLATRAVPWVDTLTFTHVGERWIDQSWLFDALLAFVVDLGGWSTAALLSALGIAAIYSGLTRWLLTEGRSPLVVLVVAMLAAGIGAIHFLIRPHLVTLGFVLITLRACQRQHERGGRSILALPALVVIWANMHGGFLAAPIIVFSAALGHAVSGPWSAARRREVATFLGAGGLCLLAALVNPYGFELYRHVYKLMVSSGVTALIEEHSPVPFGKPDARVFEWVLLALVAVPTISRGRMSGYELVHALVWLHLSLASFRHAPLFALAVAPGFARLLDGLPLQKYEPGEIDVAARWSVWPLVAGLGLALAVALGAKLGGFDPEHWPLAALPSLNRAPSQALLFHEQDWGGLIAADTRPPRPTFIDDRFELFGTSGVLRYLNALEGGPGWDQIRDRDAIRLAWLRPDRGLTRRLAADPAWTVLHKDALSVLFEKTGTEQDIVLKNSFSTMGLTFPKVPPILTRSKASAP